MRKTKLFKKCLAFALAAATALSAAPYTGLINTVMVQASAIVPYIVGNSVSNAEAAYVGKIGFCANTGGDCSKYISDFSNDLSDKVDSNKGKTNLVIVEVDNWTESSEKWGIILSGDGVDNAETTTIYYTAEDAIAIEDEESVSSYLIFSMSGEGFADDLSGDYTIAVWAADNVPENAAGYTAAVVKGSTYNFKLGKVTYEAAEQTITPSADSEYALVGAYITLPEIEDSDYVWSDGTNQFAGRAYVEFEKDITYTAVSKTAAAIVKEPQAISDLSYTGEAQELITAGEAQNGTMEYYVSEDEISDFSSATFDEEIPTEADAGTYYVYYMVEGDETHTDVEANAENMIEVTISEGRPSCRLNWPAQLTYNGEEQNLVTAASATNGTIYYSTNYNAETEAGDWSNNIPKETNVGEYTVYYKVEGYEGYADLGPSSDLSFTVEIVGAEISASDSLYISSSAIDENSLDVDISDILSEKLSGYYDSGDTVTAETTYVGADVEADLTEEESEKISISFTETLDATDADVTVPVTLTFANDNYESTLTVNVIITNADDIATITVSGGGNKTYDGSEANITVTIKDGEETDIVAEATSIVNLDDVTFTINGVTATAFPTDAGTYNVVISYEATEDDKTTKGVVETSLIIGQKTLTATITGDDSKKYDGTTAVSGSATLGINLADIVGEDEVDASATFAYISEDAGTKTVFVAAIELTGGDKDNYMLDSGVVTKEVTGITKAENKWTTPLTCANTTGTPSPNAVAKFGSVTFTYSDSENGTYTDKEPTSAGKYYVKAYVEGTNNYTGLESDAVSFEITAASSSSSGSSSSSSSSSGSSSSGSTSSDSSSSDTTSDSASSANADGSTTVTTTDAAGNVTETTTSADGKTVTTEVANADGTGYVTKEVTSESGTVTTSTVETDASGYATAVTVSTENASGGEKTVEYEVSDSGTLTVSNVDTNVKSLSIPKTVKAADGNTYSVTAIASGAAKGEKTLTKLTVGSNVESIGSGAFRNCTSLKSVTIGSGITKISKNAFRGDSALKKVTINCSSLKSVGKNAFSGISSKAVIVLKGTKKQVAKATKLLKKSGISSKVTIKRG